ncbi:MAG TPA: hypothetical protein VLH39_08085, partial [Magnetospirillaceae bacterium]|nr:hypothetical protein [Magnetospirillaceae bacterium]
PGARPESGYFSALAQGQNLEISRRPLVVWTIEAGLTMLAFPEVWAHLAFGEGRYFLRFGFSQLLAGLFLADEEVGWETPPALLSLPLVMPGAGLGMYFLPEDSYIRPYGYAAAFFRILLMEGAFGLDPVASFGLHAVLGTEWRALPNIGFFAELGAVLYPGVDGFLVAASRKDQDSGGPFWWFFGDSWFFEAPLLRVGARFSL